MSMEIKRQPHISTDLRSRNLKGAKIERLLGLRGGARPIRLLEVGAGSGGISHYFATHPSLSCDVDAVDVVDNREISDSYRFSTVTGTELPFGDRTFDVVVSNHVIEHVGNADAQMAHLHELRRVMRTDGQGYIAVPNRWMVIEPHFRLAFLSWLPRRWRTPYLRAMGKGDFYDCEPLQMGQLEEMLLEAGLDYRNLCAHAVRATFDLERPESFRAQLLHKVSDRALESFERIIPTLTYRISPHIGDRNSATGARPKVQGSSVAIAPASLDRSDPRRD